MFLPHPRVKVSIVGSLRDREVACSASDRQGSNFESCVWRTVSSQSFHHPQEVLLAQFSLYVHKGGLKPDSFHFHFACPLILLNAFPTTMSRSDCCIASCPWPVCRVFSRVCVRHLSDLVVFKAWRLRFAPPFARKLLLFNISPTYLFLLFFIQCITYFSFIFQFITRISLPRPTNLKSIKITHIFLIWYQRRPF